MTETTGGGFFDRLKKKDSVSEHWDRNTGTLTVEKSHELKRITETAISLLAGNVTIVGTDKKNPQLVTRLKVGESSEKAAKAAAKAAKNFQVTTEGHRLVVTGGSEGDQHTTVDHSRGGSLSARTRRGYIGQGETVVGVSIGTDGKITAGGQSWDDGTRGTSTFTGTEREVILHVPRGEEGKYKVNASRGDVSVTDITGTFDIKSPGGSVSFEDTTFRGESKIETGMDNVTVSTKSESLGLTATTRMGSTDFPAGFTPTSQDRTTTKGYIGNNPSPNAHLTVNTSMGHIRLSKA